MSKKENPNTTNRPKDQILKDDQELSKYYAGGKRPKIVQLTDRFGNDFYFGNAGDVWVRPEPIGEDTDYRTQVRGIRDMEIRPDDVLICSFPKTGRHWHREIVKMLMNKSSNYIHYSDHQINYLELWGAHGMKNLPSPRLPTTHLPFRYIPRQALQKKIKIIYLDRNPKDTLVSWYNHIHIHKQPMGFSGTFEHFFRLYMDCGLYYGDLFDYLMEWQRGREANPDVPIYVSVYEDMKQDPVGGVKKLNEFLGTGCSNQLCEDIAKACSFQSLKANKLANAPEYMKTMFKDNELGLYRKGEVGDWKNWFTVAMNEELDREYKKRMSEYKLEYKFTL